MDIMSVNTEVLYQRGKYFIETGSGKIFQGWFKRTCAGFNVPDFLIKRIGDLMNQEDRDSAITLWMKICGNISRSKKKIKRKIYIGNILTVVVVFCAVFTIVKLL